MPVTDPYAWAFDSTYSSNTITFMGSSSIAPVTIYPAAVAIPTLPESTPDDSPIAWLRGQVSEICDLARAA